MEEGGGNANLKSKNSSKSGSRNLSGYSPKSPKLKNSKQTQSNTINTWLTKDSRSGCTKELDAKKNPQNNSSKPSEHNKPRDNKGLEKKSESRSKEKEGICSKETANLEASSSLSRNMTLESRKIRNKKRRHRDKSNEITSGKLESVDSLNNNTKEKKKGSTKSSAKSSESLNCSKTEIVDENRVRKKFKRIITSPLSTNSIIKTFSEKNRSLETSPLYKWLNKRDDNESTSKLSNSSNRDNNTRKNQRENIKIEFKTQKNCHKFSTPTKHSNDLQSLKRSLRNSTSPHASPSSSIGKEPYNDKVTTPSKQKNNLGSIRKSPRNSTSPYSSPNTSVAKKLFNGNITTPTKQKSDLSSVRKSPRYSTSPDASPSTSVAKKLFKDNITTPTKQKNDLSSVRKSPRLSTSPVASPSTSVAKKLSEDNITTPTKQKNNLSSVRKSPRYSTSPVVKKLFKDNITTSTKRKIDLGSVRKSSRNSTSPNASPSTPIAKKRFVPAPSKTADTWISKNSAIDKLISKHSKNSSKIKTNNPKQSKKYEQLDVKLNKKEVIGVDSRKKSRTKKKAAAQSIKNFLDKSCSKQKESLRSVSKENVNNKKSKNDRISDSFKKYGVAVPSVEEILKDQADLANYKTQIESFKDIDDKFFELQFSVIDLKKNPVTLKDVLGCKHLSMDDIEKAFQNNLNYISDIFHGKTYNERHDRFFNNNAKSYTFTLKDLCYSTSTIVFSFEQKEHLISLLKREFDPDDKWTSYFFQVLLPELCLKIFIDTHCMTYDEAVKYLDTRPILDD